MNNMDNYSLKAIEQEDAIEAEQLFRPQLMEDEYILWCGRPQPETQSKKKLPLPIGFMLTLSVVLFPLFCITFKAGWEFVLTHLILPSVTNREQVDKLLAFNFDGIAQILALILLILVFRELSKMIKDSKPDIDYSDYKYAITNRRVMTSTGTRILSKDLTTILYVKFREFGDGMGTVFFCEHEKFNVTHYGNTAVLRGNQSGNWDRNRGSAKRYDELYNVINAPTVYAILADAVRCANENLVMQKSLRVSSKQSDAVQCASENPVQNFPQAVDMSPESVSMQNQPCASEEQVRNSPQAVNMPPESVTMQDQSCASEKQVRNSPQAVNMSPESVPMRKKPLKSRFIQYNHEFTQALKSGEEIFWSGEYKFGYAWLIVLLWAAGIILIALLVNASTFMGLIESSTVRKAAGVLAVGILIASIFLSKTSMRHLVALTNQRIIIKKKNQTFESVGVQFIHGVSTHNNAVHVQVMFEEDRQRFQQYISANAYNRKRRNTHINEPYRHYVFEIENGVHDFFNILLQLTGVNENEPQI